MDHALGTATAMGLGRRAAIEYRIASTWTGLQWYASCKKDCSVYLRCDSWTAVTIAWLVDASSLASSLK